jgi:hypothetical protein
VGAILANALLTEPARASLIVHRTRENGANAVRIGSHVFTLDDWMDFRESDPEWFARNSPRLGRALAKGKDYLLDRRALNPRRFDHYHPCLGWLLRDPAPDELTNTGGPFLPPTIPQSVIPPIDLQPPPGGGGGGAPPPGGGGDTPLVPQAVPEPSGWVLMASAAAGMGLLRLACGKARLGTRLMRRHENRKTWGGGDASRPTGC